MGFDDVDGIDAVVFRFAHPLALAVEDGGVDVDVMEGDGFGEIVELRVASCGLRVGEEVGSCELRVASEMLWRRVRVWLEDLGFRGVSA